MGRSNMCNIHTAKKTERTQEEITISGNPAKPQGEDGATMLKRMNESHSPVTCWALEHWQIAPEEELLDIGCGGGATLKRMGEKITTGHLTGVDYSPVSVKTSLKTNRQDVESGKMKVLEGSVEALPFADDGFDKIITVESFYFWPDPQENLKEVRRVVRSCWWQIPITKRVWIRRHWKIFAVFTYLPRPLKNSGNCLKKQVSRTFRST